MAEAASECSVKVFCRVRPLNKSEEASNSKFIAKFPSEEAINVAVRPSLISSSVLLLSLSHTAQPLPSCLGQASVKSRGSCMFC